MNILCLPMFKQLNWDVIDNTTTKTLISCTRSWNKSNELFKGLRFESKKDFAICYEILIVCELESYLWAVRYKKWQVKILKILFVN